MRTTKQMSCCPINCRMKFMPVKGGGVQPLMNSHAKDGGYSPKVQREMLESRGEMIPYTDFIHVIICG